MTNVVTDGALSIGVAFRSVLSENLMCLDTYQMKLEFGGGNMKFKYRDCEVDLTYEKSIAGDKMWFWSIFDETGYEVSSGFEDSEDEKEQKIKDMKSIIDDYKEHPEEYE